MYSFTSPLLFFNVRNFPIIIQQIIEFCNLIEYEFKTPAVYYKVNFNTFNIFVSSYLIKDTVYYINDTKICFVIVITGGIT